MQNATQANNDVALGRNIDIWTMLRVLEHADESFEIAIDI